MQQEYTNILQKNGDHIVGDVLVCPKNHIMYEWNVDVFNVDTKETKEDNKNVCLTYVDNDFGYVRYSSFDCIADYDNAILTGIKFVVNDLI